MARDTTTLTESVEQAKAGANTAAALSRRIAASLLALWDAMGPESFSASARQPAAPAVMTLANGQRAAADIARQELARRIHGDWGRVLLPVPNAYAGTTAAGYPLGNLLQAPGRTVSARIAGGLSAPEAMAAGRIQLGRVAENETFQAFTNATSAGLYGVPQVQGYARALVGDSCPRCVILAGRIYRFEEPFKRHPLCNCVHVPVEDVDSARDEWEPAVFSPRGYFDSMTPEQQDQWIGKANAQAIRDGADIGEVVRASAKRGGREAQGLYDTALPDGRKVQATWEGTTVREGRAGRRLAVETGQFQDGHLPEKWERAAAPRLTPRSIYDVARTPDEARDLLRHYGYLDPNPIDRSLRGLFGDLRTAGAPFPDGIEDLGKR